LVPDTTGLPNRTP